MLDALALTALYEAHQAYLWGLAYRMTGTVEDADDSLQETFLRLMEQPPGPGGAGLPWLTRAALDVSRAALAARQAEDYAGPWLPGPALSVRLEIPGAAPEGRYSLPESAGFAFLLALEGLTADQRAAVLLRDVFALPADVAAASLGGSPAEVDALLADARQALQSYDARRPAADLPERVGPALERLIAASRRGDAAAVGALLTEQARVTCDGAGELLTTAPPRAGRAAVAAFCLQLASDHGPAAVVQVASVNGLPAAVWRSEAPAGVAERSLLRVELGAGDAIREVQCVQAPGKLAGLWGFGAGD